MRAAGTRFRILGLVAAVGLGFAGGLLAYWPTRSVKIHIQANLGGRGALFGPYHAAVVGDSFAWTGRWSHLCPGRKFANFGRGGESSVTVNMRLSQYRDTSARRIFLMMGLSDAWTGRSAEAIAADYRSIAKALRKDGRQITILSVPFPHQAMARVYRPLRYYDPVLIAAVNKQLQAVAEAEGLGFVDANPVLAPRGELLQSFTTDGLHLTDDAYARIVKLADMCA
jgi:hypothetical protein